MAKPDFTIPAPTAPSRAEPAQFSSRADAFLSWMEQFGNEIGASLQWFEDRADEADAAAGAAQQTGQDRVATGQDRQAVEVNADYMRATYLGAQPTNPSVDLNGDPVQDGAWYDNTTIKNPRLRRDGSWVDAVLPSSGGETFTVSQISDFPDFADVATSGEYGDLENIPIVAAVSQVRALTGENILVPSKVKDAAAPTTSSGSSNLSPNFTGLINTNWTITANRTLLNPANVIPGKTVSVSIKGNNATERTVVFGSYYKGDLPEVVVSNTASVTLFLYAVSATEILVSEVEW